MEGFTIIDGVVALVIVISAILAYSRGFVREALSIGGWIAAAVVAFLFAPKAEPLVREIPVVKDFLGDSCELSMIAAFAGVFALALVVVSIFTPLFSSAVRRSAIGGLDQGLGFLFGVLRGLVLVAIALVVYDRVILEDSYPMVDDSRTAKIFARAQDSLNDAIPEDAPGWIVKQYEKLVGSCGAKAE
ncbi:MAG TPA: CvpA family protein [Rhodobacteraceae bacterium]|nr:CvpA family protein [Paracoccaceae bacterium]